MLEDSNIIKYYCYYSPDFKTLSIDYNYISINGSTYFISREVAQRTIDEIIKPFFRKV